MRPFQSRHLPITIALSPSEAGVLAAVPWQPHTAAVGATEEEALRRCLVRALRSLADRIELGEQPVPTSIEFKRADEHSSAGAD